MNKLLTILLASAFATGAAVAQTSSNGVNTGDLAGSNTPSGTGAATVGTTHATTAEKRAMRSGDSSTGSAGGTGAAAATGTLGASGDTGLCAPGADKNDRNNCMPGSRVGNPAKPMAGGKAMDSGKAEGEAAQDKTDKTNTH